MARFSTPLQIYRLLPQTNCRQCHLPACLAFAAAVLKGERQLADCPYLAPEVAAAEVGDGGERASMDRNMDEAAARLQARIGGIDLVARAAAAGGRQVAGGVAVQCLGKDFCIAPDGAVTSQCHINPWVTVPLLHYLLESPGLVPVGEWVAMRDLAGGPAWSPLFGRRCEEPLQRLADRRPGLFADLVGIFSGRETARYFDADISILLRPLPRVPILICYWRPEDDLDSRLRVYFDRTAERNLGVELLHTLGVGMVAMFEKIGLHHG